MLVAESLAALHANCTSCLEGLPHAGVNPESCGSNAPTSNILDARDAKEPAESKLSAPVAAPT